MIKMTLHAESISCLLWSDNPGWIIWESLLIGPVISLDKEDLQFFSTLQGMKTSDRNLWHVSTSSLIGLGSEHFAEITKYVQVYMSLKRLTRVNEQICSWSMPLTSHSLWEGCHPHYIISWGTIHWIQWIIYEIIWSAQEYNQTKCPGHTGNPSLEWCTVIKYGPPRNQLGSPSLR